VKNEDGGLVFRRVAFVSLARPSEDVVGHVSIVPCEDLGAFRRLGVEILKKRGNGRKMRFLGLFFVVSGSFFVAHLLETWGSVPGMVEGSILLCVEVWGVKKAKYGVNFAFLVDFGCFCGS
jgi:uncharacterized membrane protein